MSKNSVKTILITLYLSAVQDPEPLYKNPQLVSSIKFKLSHAMYIRDGVKKSKWKGAQDSGLRISKV